VHVALSFNILFAEEIDAVLCRLAIASFRVEPLFAASPFQCINMFIVSKSQKRLIEKS